MTFLNRKNSIILALIILANLLLCYLVMGLGMDFIYVENSWMENIQASVLLVSSAIFAVMGFKLEGRNRVLGLFFAVLCFIFAFREVDVDKLDVPQWLIFLLAEKGRAVFFILAFALLGWILKDTAYYWRYLKLYLSSSLGVYVSVAAFLLIFLSSAFDQKVLDVPYRIFFEELSEMLAYCLLFAAAIDLRRCLLAIDKTVAEQIAEKSAAEV